MLLEIRLVNYRIQIVRLCTITYKHVRMFLMCFNLVITFSNSNYIINLYARYVSYLNFGMKIVLH